MDETGYNIAVVGATGAVGSQMVSILAECRLPVKELRVFASPQSSGNKIHFNDSRVPLRPLSPGCFEHIDIALFSAGAGVTKKWASEAVGAGALVIDNTSQYRMDRDVPLVVPEVNPHELDRRPVKGIVANPNCSTIQMVVVLKPIYDLFGLKRVVVATYQAVSGAGRSAMDELSNQVVSLYNNRPVEVLRFPRQIAFNCIPKIGDVLENGCTTEEMKMVLETRKIMGLPGLRISAATVRVPVFHSHSEAVWLETDRPVDPNEAMEALRTFPGIQVLDEPDKDIYPTALDAAGNDMVMVGRIRRDTSVENGLSLWIVADNLRKGAALNAVQIAELMHDHGALKAKP
ncbi:MAG: aspartate-semialdehyde dehydrogenase [Deltaproteobacteria bacterium]|nr:aspartate-semialdehyde dehydrogenase [Deltaproteobacteria bacterium]